MSGETTSPPRTSRRLSRLLRLGMPLGASLCVHAALAGVLIFSAWSIRPGGEVGHARSEVLITVPTPTTETAMPDAGAMAGPARPAIVEAPPPRLQGLTTPSLAPPPALRSAAVEVTNPGELLRSQDDSAIQGATFAGMGAKRAASVVYVVDASGAMVSSLKFVLAELERSVRNLSSAQKFQVVLFRERAGDGGVSLYEVFSAGGDPAHGTLLPATPGNKAALREWLKTIMPAGRSNPLDGLRLALGLQPDAVFLLSRSIRRSGGAAGDGTGAAAIGESAGGVWGRGKAEILAELDRLNPRRGGQRRAVIKAIQFLEEDPTGTMQAIGSEHGDGPGSYSVVTLRALGGGEGSSR